MDERKNHPSLPSNYVTLAQLQERWLNQHNQINQPQPQNHHKLRNGTASQSRPQKQYVVKNRNDSQTLRPVVEEASYDHRKSETGAGIGDKTDDLNGKKTSESKKKKWNKKMKPKTKTEEKGASGEGSGAAAQRTIESDLKEETEKATIESGTKEKKKEGLVTKESAEQRVRVSWMNSGNGEQNGGFGKMKNGFFHSQFQRKNYGYGYGNRNSNGNGEHSRVQVQGREKMVWVKKDEIAV